MGLFIGFTDAHFYKITDVILNTYIKENITNSAKKLKLKITKIKGR